MGIKTDNDKSGTDLKSPATPTDPGTMRAMEKTAEFLVMAYLAANLNFKDIPLKQLLDDCEKKILVDCLHMTRGSQRNAAALLGLKPTALFEKMRKHGINARQIKLAEKIAVLPAEEND